MKILQKLKQKAKKLRTEVQVLELAYADERTPLLARFLIGLTVAYLLSPIDLIPDFIPVLGILDDLIIVPLLINASIRLIPDAVMQDAREAVATNPATLKKNRWGFAFVIIAIWIVALVLTYRYAATFWVDHR